MKKAVFALTPIFFSEATLACPFCEFGASDVAYFIVTVFGLFALSGVFLLLYFWRAGSFSSSDNTAIQVLKAEGISERQEGSNGERSEK